MILLLSALAFAQEPAAVGMSGVIEAVTVFPDRAAVTRVLTQDVQAGVNEVRFEDLPPTLHEASLQADGEGTADAMILGLDVQTRELAEDRRARVAELEDAIVATQDEIDVQRDIKAAAQAELNFLTKLQTAAAKQLSAEMMFADGTVADAAAVAELLRTRVPEVQVQMREANQEGRDLGAKLSALKRELNGVKGAKQWSRRDVAVTVEAKKAGKISIELTYVLPGASWTPSYDARAEVDDGKVALTLFGMVTQTTGEDWSEAALTLSTARPSGGVSPPKLTPFWLEESYSYAYDEPVWEDSDEYLDFDGEIEEEAAYLESDKATRKSGGAAPPPPPPKPMEVATAKVVERAIATTFEVPGTANIPGDGTRRKIRVTDATVDANFVHVAVPRLEEAAFLMARTTWDQGWPMLAGRVSSFLDGSFIGSARSGLVGQGSELEIGFGRDDAIQIQRTVVTDLTSSPNMLGQVTLDRQWTLAVTNGRKTPITIELNDRIPVARESFYKVKPSGDEPDEDLGEGLVRFVRETAAGESSEVPFGYRVRWPNRHPPGALP